MNDHSEPSVTEIEAPDLQPAITPDVPVESNGANDYGEESVKSFQGTAHIRQRPGMYIGNTSVAGLHHLVYELVHNSVDEALAGYCTNITVKVNVDHSITVGDDGRGIPVEMHSEAKMPTLEMVMTQTGSGAKFDHNTYKVSAGLHGYGSKAVTALSEWCEAKVRRNGKVYVQEYERGVATTPVTERGTANKTGTTVTFKPDPQIFGDSTFDYDTLEGRLRELAFLNKGIAVSLKDERAGKEQEDKFHYEGGIAEYVEYLNRTEEALHTPIYFEKLVDQVNVEIALQYTNGEDERTRCYTNNAYNPVGGTHLIGFRTALTRTLRAYGDKEDKFKNINPIGEDFREGMTAVISVQHPDPQLEAQTKIRLNNPEVEGIVSGVVSEHLSRFLEEHPKDAAKIMKKVAIAAEAREAATKAKKALKERKNILSSGGLPGKLMDCTTRDRDESELFLVEGQSAGGSADNGRDRMFQAILPLRGKVLNVEKARVERVLGNEEICNLISAVGVDIGNTEDVANRRYGKVVLLTDADVDGQHIRTLLLTFFYRQMRKLIEDGVIYVARPPLYKVTQKKKVRYVQTDEEMNVELMERGMDATMLTIVPPENEKGEVLGEPALFEKERLGELVAILDELERSLFILEKRGINIATFFQNIHDGKLPPYRVVLGQQQHWFFKSEDVDAFRDQQQREGRELLDAEDESNENGTTNGTVEAFSVLELHEVRAVNQGLEKLREFGVNEGDLIPPLRLAGREPQQRFLLKNDEREIILPQLRELVQAIRKLGERGISVMRFKGLGEMDGDELWETTLDPAKRTLLQVRLNDALQADDMFRILMGEKVEPRRHFIQKHALEVKEIDYHGA